MFASGAPTGGAGAVRPLEVPWWLKATNFPFATQRERSQPRGLPSGREGRDKAFMERREGN